MTLFTLLYIRRSDGKLEVTGKSRQKEKNEPQPGQLDPTPNAKGISDYYRPIAYTDQKHSDWRKKLAGMLMRELSNHEYSDKAYILDDLPDNYRLFEHVKSRSADAAAATGKGTKTHAGGGLDRQDAYLYGHPQGRRKRYRSPADFFPHLLWLVTDEKGDVNNCTCKVCAPDEIQPDAKPELKRESAPVKKESIAPQNQPLAYRGPVVEIRIPASTAALKKSLTATSSTLPNARVASTSPLPQPRTIDQQIDALYDKFTFRPGEAVWFDRGGQQTWGLGVIVQRWMLPGAPGVSNRAYLMQPLSHPFNHLPQQVITKETSMKPWLAWSPPPYTHAGLNGLDITFETADWSAISRGTFGPGELTVDGSILAANAIDVSYTPFGWVKSVPPNTYEQIHWNGVFVGAEKLWVGEPARIRMASEEDVLVITEIIEKPLVGYQTNDLRQATRTAVTLIGDVYRACTSPPENPAPQQDDGSITSRMKEDMKLRNRIASYKQGPTHFWKLLRVQQSFNLSEIKGRWYEWSTMMPILKSDKVESYQQDMRNGVIMRLDGFLNARGQHIYPNAGLRRNTREAAFGRAVPASLKVLDGTDAPDPSRLPQSHPASQSQPQPQTFAPQTDLTSDLHAPQDSNTEMVDVDQFMKFDDMEHDGFGDGYGGQIGFFNP